MVSGLKNSVHKEVEIDGYMQHTISKINKGTWDYDSNIQIPIIIINLKGKDNEKDDDLGSYNDDDSHHCHSRSEGRMANHK